MASSDLLKNAYASAGALAYFFEKFVPRVNLWRGLKKESLADHARRHPSAGSASFQETAKISVEPITKGFQIVTKKGRRWREPDVNVFMRNNQEWVKGCRTTRGGGEHWGISLWDAKPVFAGNGWISFCLPGKDAKDPIPVPIALAITQDDDNQYQPNHYTVAPKDDMPLDLYVQHLKQLADHFTEWKDRGA